VIERPKHLKKLEKENRKCCFLLQDHLKIGTNEEKGVPYESEVSKIKEALVEKFRYAIIFDPYDVYVRDRVHVFSKTQEPGKSWGVEVYKRSLEIAAAADVLIAYLPKRSMGTADEMSFAKRNKRLVISICPPVESDPEGINNWTVIAHSNIRYTSVGDFIEGVKSNIIQRELRIPEINIPDEAKE
jgi:hypothetical protein